MGDAPTCSFCGSIMTRKLLSLHELREYERVQLEFARAGGLVAGRFCLAVFHRGLKPCSSLRPLNAALKGRSFTSLHATQASH